MKRYLISAFIFILTSGVGFADRESEQKLQLTENGIVSTNASGDSQTTVIDANGNLKMVPVNPNVKSNAPPTTSQNVVVSPPGGSSPPIGKPPNTLAVPGQLPEKAGTQAPPLNVPANPGPIKQTPYPSGQNQPVSPPPFGQ